MIIDPTDPKDLKISVITDAGEVYDDCDCTSSPFGESERFVSFWHNGYVRVIPMHRVKVIDMDFGPAS